MNEFKLTALFGACLLAGCVSSGTIVDRPGATAAQARAAHDSCHVEVKQPYQPTDGTVAGAATSGFFNGVSGVMAQERAVDACMEKRGYLVRTLSEAEKRKLAAASRGAARDAELDAIMRSNDYAPVAASE